MAGKKRSGRRQRDKERGDPEVLDGDHAGDDDKVDGEEQRPEVYMPGMPLEKDEELEADLSAYVMLHSLTTEWPCLSFDVLAAPCPPVPTKYPQTAYIVAGSQADAGHDNCLYLMRWSGLARTGGFTEEEEAEMVEEEDSLESREECRGDPVTDVIGIHHPGGCNRIRTLQLEQRSVVASWSDTGRVYVWDVTEDFAHLTADNWKPRSATSKRPSLFSVGGHSTEGFALAWSSANKSLVSGDCAGSILLTPLDSPHSSARFTGHQGSVEDCQWSPKDLHVFASCSTDQTVRLWDERSGKSETTWKLHDCDINVLSWNPSMAFLLATGGDDGSMKIWDLRQGGSDGAVPVGTFSWHRAPITSLQWHPSDSSVVAATGADDQLTIWDLAVERDVQQLVQDGGRLEDELDSVPAQLLFIHQGQRDMKELHWHPQLAGTVISTAADGFNIFKTISV